MTTNEIKSLIEKTFVMGLVIAASQISEEGCCVDNIQKLLKDQRILDEIDNLKERCVYVYTKN